MVIGTEDKLQDRDMVTVVFDNESERSISTSMRIPIMKTECERVAIYDAISRHILRHSSMVTDRFKLWYIAECHLTCPR